MNERIERTFTRAGFTAYVGVGTMEEVYAQAREAWEKEGREIAAALRITAEEYARQARRGLVAEHVAANAKAYAARPDTQGLSGRSHAAALFVTAARLREECAA